MSTDKFLQEAIKAGMHKEFKVTPVTMSAGVRTLLPPSPMVDRKTIYIAHMGSSTDILWVGNNSVSTTSATTSGIPVYYESHFSADLGRAEVYGITTTNSLAVKVLEIA